MKKLLALSLMASSVLVTLQAEDTQEVRDRIPSVKKAIGSVSAVPQKELGIVDGFTHMFSDGKVAGQIRSLYTYTDYETQQDTYTTAMGGYLKYELAQYKGFSAGVAFATTYDVEFLSGDDEKRNTDLSSQKTNYTEPTELYISYSYKGLTLRAGRQIIDTPLADSDDILMVFNTFEAYTLSYKTDSFAFLAGHLKSWQGSDAGLDNGWIEVSKDGTNFAGFSYESDMLESSIWYYNIDGEEGDGVANNSLYVDAMLNLDLNKDISFHIGAQYLNQSELSNSGISAKIYGASAEAVFNGLGINVAYNKSSKESGKCSFSGFGGGTLFTSMDSMILDSITQDRDADAVVGGISYEVGDFNLLYAYGDFNGDADSAGDKEHIVEQNFGVKYSHNDKVTVAAIYSKDDDKYDSGSNDGDWENVRLLVSYNF